MANFAPAVLLCLPGLVASPRHVRVDLTIQGVSVPKTFVTAAIAEAADIWAAYGVDIRVPNGTRAGSDGAVWLAVTLAPSPNPHSETGVLGSIMFSGDAPEPTIVLYPSAASALVSAVAFGHRLEPWPAGLQDRAAARVLGRALAHEVGHFLLRSKSHSTDGLMKARQDGLDLTAPDRRRFGLSASEVRRFHAMLSASDEPPQD
jgi:hypothetical protein